MRGSRRDRRIDLIKEWEEALDIEMPRLGDEAVRLIDEFNDMMSGQRASVLTNVINLPIDLVDALTRRRKK